MQRTRNQLTVFCGPWGRTRVRNYLNAVIDQFEEMSLKAKRNRDGFRPLSYSENRNRLTSRFVVTGEKSVLDLLEQRIDAGLVH